jgi:hypothetical protein
MNRPGLRVLLIAHGFITLVAAIVLAIAPGLIPSVVGVHLDRNANLVAYLLAGAEFGIAILSFGGARLSEERALQLIVWTLIAFHGSTAALEILAYTQGVGGAILSNVAARAVIVALFVYLSKARVRVH